MTCKRQQNVKKQLVNIMSEVVFYDSKVKVFNDKYTYTASVRAEELLLGFTEQVHCSHQQAICKAQMALAVAVPQIAAYYF